VPARTVEGEAGERSHAAGDGQSCLAAAAAPCTLDALAMASAAAGPVRSVQCVALTNVSRAACICRVRVASAPEIQHFGGRQLHPRRQFVVLNPRLPWIEP